jgi:TusA-related sulfurtransferase
MAILYRTGSLDRDAAFWTPDPDYARYVHPEGTLHSAALAANARVKKMKGSPSRAVIQQEQGKNEADVLVFDAWDWDTEEYVVLNPAALRVNESQKDFDPVSYVKKFAMDTARSQALRFDKRWKLIATSDKKRAYQNQHSGARFKVLTDGFKESGLLHFNVYVYDEGGVLVDGKVDALRAANMEDAVQSAELIALEMLKNYSTTLHRASISESRKGWKGVDLDGTLAKYNGFKGDEHIGEPVPAMLARVKRWLSDGWEVRIMTARAGKPKAVEAIKKWCKEHGLPALKVTNEKDQHMDELWDDRAVQVRKNTGEPVKESAARVVDALLS